MIQVIQQVIHVIQIMIQKVIQVIQQMIQEVIQVIQVKHFVFEKESVRTIRRYDVLKSTNAGSFSFCF